MIEIDGPPMAYFGEGVDKIKYRSLAIVADNVKDVHKAVNALDSFLNTVKDTLSQVPGSIIYWRTRPSVQWANDDDPEKYYVRCRLATEPTLPESAWYPFSEPIN